MQQCSRCRGQVSGQVGILGCSLPLLQAEALSSELEGCRSEIDCLLIDNEVLAEQVRQGRAAGLGAGRAGLGGRICKCGACANAGAGICTCPAACRIGICMHNLITCCSHCSL